METALFWTSLQGDGQSSHDWAFVALVFAVLLVSQRHSGKAVPNLTYRQNALYHAPNQFVDQTIPGGCSQYTVRTERRMSTELTRQMFARLSCSSGFLPVAPHWTKQTG